MEDSILPTGKIPPITQSVDSHKKIKIRLAITIILFSAVVIFLSPLSALTDIGPSPQAVRITTIFWGELLPLLFLSIFLLIFTIRGKKLSDFLFLLTLDTLLLGLSLYIYELNIDPDASFAKYIVHLLTSTQNNMFFIDVLVFLPLFVLWILSLVVILWLNKRGTSYAKVSICIALLLCAFCYQLIIIAGDKPLPFFGNVSFQGMQFDPQTHLVVEKFLVTSNNPFSSADIAGSATAGYSPDYFDTSVNCLGKGANNYTINQGTYDVCVYYVVTDLPKATTLQITDKLQHIYTSNVYTLTTQTTENTITGTCVSSSYEIANDRQRVTINSTQGNSVDILVTNTSKITDSNGVPMQNYELNTPCHVGGHYQFTVTQLLNGLYEAISMQDFTSTQDPKDLFLQGIIKAIPSLQQIDLATLATAQISGHPYSYPIHVTLLPTTTYTEKYGNPVTAQQLHVGDQVTLVPASITNANTFTAERIQDDSIGTPILTPTINQDNANSNIACTPGNYNPSQDKYTLTEGTLVTNNSIRGSITLYNTATKQNVTINTVGLITILNKCDQPSNFSEIQLNDFIEAFVKLPAPTGQETTAFALQDMTR